MRRKVIVLFILIFSLFGFGSLKKYPIAFPEYFPQPVYDFDKNPMDSNKVVLGRTLFYDPVLSKDNSISCASCHSPYNAFAHTDHTVSHGINDQTGTRNAPALFNLAWQKKFMWDGAINHLDMQALAPISHPKEMGETIAEVADKLQCISLYRQLFFAAYKDTLVTGERILKALSQFQLTLVSANSKYDQVKQGKDSFTVQENSGYSLFKKNCSSCHREPLFSTYEFANNGLPIDTFYKDYGRFNLSKNENESSFFKIPSLRNLSFTYPYMHDGRFKKLDQVINHYMKGIVQSKTLAKELRQPIILSSNEKVDLIAFLLTLNDKEFVFAEKHQFPKTILTKNESNK